MKKQSNTLFLAQSAMIAAIYVVLTVILAPFSYGEVQVRVSEALHRKLSPVQYNAVSRQVQ